MLYIGSYRRTRLGLGTVATDLTIAVAVTSGLRHRMSPRACRAVQLGAYVAWPAVLLHGLGTGSDTRRLPVLVLTATCATVVLEVVLEALGWRLVAHPMSLPRVAAWASLAALPLPAVAPAVWTAGGPLASGWAKRSRTPSATTRTVPAADRVGAR